MALTETYQLCCRKPWHNEPAQWYGSMFKVISNLIWGCNWHCHVSSKVGTSHEEAFSQEGCLFEWLWSHLDRWEKTTFEAWKRRFILGHVNVLEIPILHQEMVDFTMQHWTQIGITDEDVAELAARKQCHIGVTQCFPPGHCCIETPATLRDLVKLVLSSMSVSLASTWVGLCQYCSSERLRRF